MLFDCQERANTFITVFTAMCLILNAYDTAKARMSKKKTNCIQVIASFSQVKSTNYKSSTRKVQGKCSFH